MSEKLCNGDCLVCDHHACEWYEPGSDREFDRYAVEIQNGEGYYDEDGRFHRFAVFD